MPPPSAPTQHPSNSSTADASTKSMSYLHERTAAWAERWIPSIFMGAGYHNYNDWMEWCVPYATAVLRRPQFDANFCIDDFTGNLNARRDMAVDICESAWQRSECSRDRRLHVISDPEPSAVVQRDLEEEAAEHRTRRRWLEREGPSRDEDRWLPDDVSGDQAHVLRHELFGLDEWQESLAAGWSILRGHLARSPPTLLWPALKTLAGACTTSHRMHVYPIKLPCLYGCSLKESAHNIDDISH
ncbi:unnamed protein product [Prorocentrum cordatum]|uniref:Uncharacterized protein n=1 Tax=Prorocentrum cordatum TaxID=2364126 RepID=A0ABN9XI25_9DINO|nr:unnamed protein product [Polarella glacialis]